MNRVSIISCYYKCVGGAERLIVDAAVELAAHGHSVHCFTSYHDKNRCFEETVSGEAFVNSCSHLVTEFPIYVF